MTHCHAATTQPLVTIDGSNTAGSVLTITGNSNIILRDLTITRGAASASAGGGGIQFDGTGSLYLDTSTVSLNYAGYGGGININGNGGAATLTLGANSLVLNNEAQYDGGGIRLTGQARLFALQPQTLIAYNQAPNGNGGGIAVVGPARADIGSAGYNGAPVIEFNSAAYGGGIAAAASGTSSAEVRAFTVDANNPVQISNNSASHTGGGVYLKPYISGTDHGDATFCAFDYRIDSNIAQEGTAIYSDLDTTSGADAGGTVELNGSADCGPESPPTLGSVPCTPGVACNTMNNNVAEDSGNNPTPGSTILLQDQSLMAFGNRLIMRGNQGAHAIRAFDSQIGITNCLIADNTLTAEMIRIENDGGDVDFFYLTDLDGCTIVNNSNQGAPVIYSAHRLTLTNSIIDEESIVTLNYTANPADLNVSYVLSNDTSTLQGGTGVIQGAPTYVDAAGHDYHLQATSIGIDYAPATGGYDLDRVPRDVDLAPVPNNYGPRDIGAYERQYVCTADTIFCNGFDTYQ